jgi:hypothetical protein
MGVISRDIISENFVGINLKDGAEYDKAKLGTQIDKWKYFLVNNCDAKRGDKILIGLVDISVDFVALCFAAFELTLVIVIADQEPIIEIGTKNLVNPKVSCLMPIDILIWEEVIENGFDPLSKKLHYFKENCKQFQLLENFYTTEFPEDLTDVSHIKPNETDILMLTTTSGSTGTAKIVGHTHDFFYNLCKRNSNAFAGTVIHTKNMHHGSSLSVFYLPSLASDSVTTNYFLSLPSHEEPLVKKFIYQIEDLDLNHISIPYIKYLDSLFDAIDSSGAKFPNLTVSLLTYIPSYCRKYIEEGSIKQVESIFGSNETAGPVFMSKMNHDTLHDFDSRKFYAPDNFYHIELINKELNVTLPIYQKTIKTNDLFETDGENYLHIGRSDLVRINDVIVNFNFFVELCESYSNQIVLVTDAMENKIYLVIQKNSTLHRSMGVSELIEQLNNKIRSYYSTDRLEVNKYLIEDFSVFLNGIKMDRELVRGYFRNYV